jgi:hypothetical protein
MEAVLSRSTFFTRRVLPVLCIGWALVWAVVAVPERMWERDPLFLVGPALMIVIAVFLYRRLASNLVDEVRDGGSFLVVRKGEIEDRIALADILHINASSVSYPDRLTLRLRTPGRFGDQIDFLVGKDRWPLDPRPSKVITESLIRRVDEARRGEKQ